MSNQLPLPRQIPQLIHVADITCDNKFGTYTTPVYARPGEKTGDAINERVKDLINRGNIILKTVRLNQ